MSNDSDLRALVKYVHAVADLADSMAADLKHGDRYRTETVVCLSKLASATERVTKLFERIEGEQNTKLQ
jgi:hypothetical protein